MSEWGNRFRGFLSGRKALDHDLAEELRAHLAMETEHYAEAGMKPQEARNAARRHLGNAAAIAERSRETWGFPSFESLLQDIQYGFRAMRRAPVFSLVVILTFALGVGVNAAIFSVVNSVLLKPLPFPHAERLVRLGEANAKGDFSVSWGNFNQWRDGNHTFDDMAAYQYLDRTLTGRGDAVSARGLAATAAFFPMLGMQSLMGRLLGPADDQPGAPATVVVTHKFWTSRLGGDPNIVGQNLTLNGTLVEVVGVSAPLWIPWQADYFLALGRLAGVPASRGQHGSMRAIGRLKHGATLAAARGDLDAMMRHLAETDPGPEADHHSFGALLSEESTGDVRGTLWVLMGAAALILLIACANVASLLLARNTARAGELALRQAIGAGRMRLVRQLLTENVVLAATGGLAGVAFAYWGVRLLLGVAPLGIPRLADTTIDLPVLLFALGITLAAGLLAGLAPVMLAGRIELTSALKEGARSMGGGRHRQRFRNGLVVGEVALTFVLAFGSGILLRSLAAAQRANPGFDPRNVLAFLVDLPSKSYKNDAAVGQFYGTLLSDLRRLPGVTDASTVHCPPSAGDCGDWFYSVPGRALPPRDQVPIALFNMAEPGYFHAMRIPLLQGREFTDTDRTGSAKVAVINQALARAWWPHETAIGQQIKVGGPYQQGSLLQIVGVAGDLRQAGLDSEPAQEIFQPASQVVSSAMWVVVRTAGDASALMPWVRSRVAAMDRNLPLQKFGTLEEALGAGLARRRFSALLLTLFAGLAMSLAAVGIYGLLSYWVSSREPEIAIRLALGARQAAIVRWTTLHALRLAVAGVAIGIAGGWLAARVLNEMVFGIEPRNPATMVGAALAVTVLAFLAAVVPAWRAARVNVAHRLHHG